MPLTWEVFPAALSTAIQYASLNFPVDEGWTRYNGLQQLSYFITVFVSALVSIATGLMQSPAISNALGWFCRLFNRQAMRSVHFLSCTWFVGFILAHGAMVFVTGIRQNTNHMFGGVDDAYWTGFPLFLLAMAIMIAAWLVASPCWQTSRRWSSRNRSRRISASRVGPASPNGAAFPCATFSNW